MVLLINEDTFISTNCEAMIRHILAPLSFHIVSIVALDFAERTFVLHFLRNAFKASKYAIWSLAQYFRRACITSSSNGRRRSNRYARVDGGPTAFRTAKRFVHSTEVWLNRRRRDKHASRKYHNF